MIGLSLFDFKQLLVDSGTIVQCTAHERGIANAVKVGQNHFFFRK